MKEGFPVSGEVQMAGFNPAHHSKFQEGIALSTAYEVEEGEVLFQVVAMQALKEMERKGEATPKQLRE